VENTGGRIHRELKNNKKNKNLTRTLIIAITFIVKLPSTQFLRFEQHPVLKHPQSLFFP
jgi:hypothetical protein